MKKLLSATLASLAMLVLPAVHAGTISDTYIGGDSHGKGDVIGASVYDISGATITRTGSVLTVTVATNFAGHAGSDPWSATAGSVGAKGIGYGDLFLASTWNPSGTDAAHIGDNAQNGTDWAYGLSLDNRWSNTGGTFKLYSLAGSNASNIDNSGDFLSSCSGCTYRDGQAVAVDTSASSTAKTVKNAANQDITGSWTVTADKQIQFTINVANTDMMNFASFAMHWGETCQNDVVEGITRVVPTPGTVPLLALGLGMMVVLRRRRTAIKARA